MNDRRLISGLSVSPGIAVGPVYVLHTELPEVTDRVITPDHVDAEVARLRDALSDVRAQLQAFRERTEERAGPEEAKIFDAQILMLDDEAFLAGVESLIRENQLSAESAFEFRALEMRAIWSQSSNATLRQRTADLAGIQIRVLQSLRGESLEEVLHGSGDQPAVVITRELTPGLMVQFEKQHVAGFGSEQGTRTAHAAILARSLGIPCVMGLVGGLERITPGQTVILDGTQGTLLVDPTPEEVADTFEREHHRIERESELEEAGSQPAVTTDGIEVALRSNLDLPEDLDIAVEHGAEGVGLVRTEFLILGRTELPSEDEQAQFFERVGHRFPNHPVVIRSYDLGGDKFPASFRAAPERNPFLGWRAIRVCFDEPIIFSTQIRAMLRARLHADIQLMLPLVTQVEELERTKELVAETMASLRSEGIPAAGELPVGVMVETPAAAMLIDQFVGRCDFLSVGTNDLTQYTLAVDRGNARLAKRFTALHPAVVRLLKRIVEGGNRAGLAVSVCGEMASEPLAAFLLIGLGYRVLSVSPKALPMMRWLVRQVDAAAAERAAESVLEAPTLQEVTEVLEQEISAQVDMDLLSFRRLPVA